MRANVDQWMRRFPCTKFFFRGLAVSLAFTVRCSSETDTETYSTASSVTSSSTGPMVNSPDKDAGMDAGEP